MRVKPKQSHSRFPKHHPHSLPTTSLSLVAPSELSPRHLPLCIPLCSHQRPTQTPAQALSWLPAHDSLIQQVTTTPQAAPRQFRMTRYVPLSLSADVRQVMQRAPHAVSLLP